MVCGRPIEVDAWYKVATKEYLCLGKDGCVVVVVRLLPTAHVSTPEIHARTAHRVLLQSWPACRRHVCAKSLRQEKIASL